jgi:hypothetical protein
MYSVLQPLAFSIILFLGNECTSDPIGEQQGARKGKGETLYPLEKINSLNFKASNQR